MILQKKLEDTMKFLNGILKQKNSWALGYSFGVAYRAGYGKWAGCTKLKKCQPMPHPVWRSAL